ncbi:MAG: hypothetical protein QOG19_1611 [Mycobacterium sp.]|nr:hypothetical protein [Mycobacterium sp.]
MARIPAALRLTTEELDELMASSWNMRIATIGPGQRINLTPLWFAWTAGRLYFYGRGQKSRTYGATRFAQSWLIVTSAFLN